MCNSVDSRKDENGATPTTHLPHLKSILFIIYLVQDPFIFLDILSSFTQRTDSKAHSVKVPNNHQRHSNSPSQKIRSNTNFKTAAAREGIRTFLRAVYLLYVGIISISQTCYWSLTFGQWEQRQPHRVWGRGAQREVVRSWIFI